MDSPQKLRVAVDFDHCLIKDVPMLTTDYELRPNAKRTINLMSEVGVYFILNTSRYGWYYRSAVKFIKQQGLKLHTEFHLHKVPADVYIDDHNIFCQEIDWYKIERELTNILNRRI